MSSIEQTTIARTDGAYLSAAAADRRAGRALPITHWRRVLVALCLAGVTAGLAGQSAPVPLAHAGGNADAAHACQQGGYANLAGVNSSGQTITFKNEGDCVSYAAHGGKFTTPLPTCVATATTGCLVFNNITLPSANNTGNSIAVTGAITFVDTCMTAGGCIQSVFPNNLATGGGDYVETTSSGTVISQGAFQIANTPGSQEGLGATIFATDLNFTTAVACTGAPIQLVAVLATLIDKNTGATQTAEIAAATTPTENLGQVAVPSTDIYVGPVSSSLITC